VVPLDAARIVYDAWHATYCTLLLPSNSSGESELSKWAQSSYRPRAKRWHEPSTGYIPIRNWSLDEPPRTSLHNLDVITSEEFAALGQHEQIARLQRLGEAALGEFGVVPIEISPLVHAENTTFKVASQHGPFNLRISRPGYQTTSNIRSEIVFLAALRKEGFRVPAPWQERVVTASHPEVPESRDCVLLGWLDGEFARGKLTVERAHKVGRVMAKLHEFTSLWSAPAGFDRQQLHEWAFGPRRPMPIDDPSPLAFEEDRKLLIEVERETRPFLATLPHDPDWFGLIHADLHLGNVLFEDEEVNLIDFDDTGFGFWLYDFSSALAYAVESEEFPILQEAMFKGYREIRALPPETSRLISPFLQLRLAGIAGWVLSRSDNPNFRDTGAEFVHRLCERIRILRALL